MKAIFLNKPSRGALVIYPLFKKSRTADASFNFLLRKLAANNEFNGRQGQMFFLFDKAKMASRVLLLGLGGGKKLTVSDVMAAFGSAVKKAAGHKPQKIAIVFNGELLPFSQAVAEAVVLGGYQPAAMYKTGKALKKLQARQIKEIEITGILRNENAKKAFLKGLDAGGAVNLTRDWINSPPNIANTDFFESKAKEIAKEIRADLTILRKKDLAKLGMNALLAVNRGSRDEARLIILDYLPKGADKKQPPVCFVGKGLIFDSGGYNLKPTGHIETMHCDKAGAVALFGLAKLLPVLGLKRRVLIVCPFTENLIGSAAVKPSEIIKTYAGKTVEIANTDAEGRLVLADAMAYAAKKFAPGLLIDLATLTGACAYALGPRYAGIFGNDENLIARLRKAGDSVDELLWPLPMHKDYDEKIKGEYADLRNADTSGERYAGASTAAAFLKEFAGKTKWAHLDIAGPAFVTDPKKYECKGATAFGVRLLLRFLEKMD